tara:strand:- start:926 stop:1147 length:222 start_codon:yes stop_codon:yes gene_type:complete
MLTKGQQKYLEEFEKFKDVIITPGRYHHKGAAFVEYEVIEIGVDEVVIKTLSSNHITTKTLHWCRKNLMEAKE